MSLNFGQNLFPPRRELLTNYDYFDVSNGVGYDIYYGFSMAGTLGTSTTKIYSGMIHTNGTIVEIPDTGTYTELLDKDFDVTFNLPKNIKGDILATIPYGMKCKAGGGARNVFLKATMSIFHYDGSTETQMGTTSTSEIITTSDGEIAYNELIGNITPFKVNQSTIKHFKKGETIRFTIKIFGKHSGSGTARDFLGGIGNDPQNTTDATIYVEAGAPTETQIIATNKPTITEFHIPFVLDI